MSFFEIFVLRNVLFWNICPIKVHLWNVLIWNSCPIKCSSNKMSFYEIFVQYMSSLEVFVQRNVLWNICPTMKYLFNKMSSYEVFVQNIVLLWNSCPMKCPSMKYLSNKSPCMKYLSNKMSIYEMFSIKSSYMKYLSNEMSFYEMFFNKMFVHETFVQRNVLLWNICPNEIS